MLRLNIIVIISLDLPDMMMTQLYRSEQHYQNQRALESLPEFHYSQMQLPLKENSTLPHDL